MSLNEKVADRENGSSFDWICEPKINIRELSILKISQHTAAEE